MAHMAVLAGVLASRQHEGNIEGKPANVSSPHLVQDKPFDASATKRREGERGGPCWHTSLRCTLNAVSGLIAKSSRWLEPFVARNLCMHTCMYVGVALGRVVRVQWRAFHCSGRGRDSFFSFLYIVLFMFLFPLCGREGRGLLGGCTGPGWRFSSAEMYKCMTVRSSLDVSILQLPTHTAAADRSIFHGLSGGIRSRPQLPVLRPHGSELSIGGGSACLQVCVVYIHVRRQ